MIVPLNVLKLPLSLTRRPITISLMRHEQTVSIEQQPQKSKDQSSTDLRKEVIALYKNLIYLSRDWHIDLRPQIKNAFMKNKDVVDAEEIRKLIGRGEYVCREIIATYNLRKYRAMKRRYYSDGENKHLEDLFKSFST